MDIEYLTKLSYLGSSRNLFSLFKDEKRSEKYSLSAAGLHLDYAKQNITDGELKDLLSLTRASKTFRENFCSVFWCYIK